MPSLMIFVWRNRDGTGDPDVEVKIPMSLAKWVPRLMRFVPKRTREETWGQDVDFEGMIGDIERLVKEAMEGGQPELVTIKTREGLVKITIEK